MFYANVYTDKTRKDKNIVSSNVKERARVLNNINNEGIDMRLCKRLHVAT